MTTIALVPDRPNCLPTTAAVMCAALAAAALVGCDREHARVRSYSVPKEAVPVSAPPVEHTHTTPSGTMEWDLPAGWRTVENTISMRFATMTAGAGDDLIEIAVTQLGGAAGGFAANVNRWRGQVGLEPASEDEIAMAAIPVQARGARGIVVDLPGPATGGPEDAAPRMFAAIFPAGSSTWFIKSTGPRAVMERHLDGFMELCTSVRFSGSDPQTPPAASPPPPPSGTAPRWAALPDGWSLDGTPKAMSVVSFTVAGDGETASLTITPLGGSQDMLSNVNRWRRQVGLGPLGKPSEAAAMPIQIGGESGMLVDMAGPDGHTIAVVATRGESTWFYKLSGPDPLVAGQRSNFEAFVRSIRFDG